MGFIKFPQCGAGPVVGVRRVVVVRVAVGVHVPEIRSRVRRPHPSVDSSTGSPR